MVAAATGCTTISLVNTSTRGSNLLLSMATQTQSLGDFGSRERKKDTSVKPGYTRSPVVERKKGEVKHAHAKKMSSPGPDDQIIQIFP